MSDPEKLDIQSLNIPEEKREELLRLFPEVRTEGGQIDFDRLRLALGDMVDTGKERYGLNWPGKSACFKAIQTPSMGTLLPAPEESVNFDTTENLIIEGDNLEVLKLLQKSYIGKIKMIYIDPPYNTGNDFIYPDNYSESLQTYLEYTGQVGEEGKRFSSNTDTDGRFHSKWLNMMYPRLYLARDLLRDDGVIFISIDDGEVAHLREILSELFGEENFIANIVWQKKFSPQANVVGFSDSHDHILVFAKNKEIWKPNLLARSEEADARFENPDNDPRGPWSSGDFTISLTGGQRGNQFMKTGVSPNIYEITTPSGRIVSPPKGRCWGSTPERFAQLVEDNRIWFGESGNNVPRIKRFRSEVQDGIVPSTWWPHTESGHNQEAKQELNTTLGDAAGSFDTPKPVRLIKRMLDIVTKNEEKEIILDFFAGSGTTAHAVIKQNFSDNGNRLFILVQLPEFIPESSPARQSGFGTIADITKERVRRVIEKLNDEDGNNKNQDRGFRVFKLAESNFTPWDGSIDQSPEALSRQMEIHIEHVRQGRSDQDILYEILLKSGFPLSIPVETLQVDGKIVYSISDGIMLVCLDRNLSLPLVQAIVDRLPERVVFLDEGFAGNDALIVNAKEACRLKNIVFKVV